MGYDVHITRKGDWFDEDGPAITREEWLTYVERDKTMRLVRKATVENSSGAAFSVQDETLAVWAEWENREEGRNEAWMWHSSGNVMAKNPDRAMLQKMFMIADALDAKVQGDEGEVYDLLGDPVREPAERRRPWWRFW